MFYSSFELVNNTKDMAGSNIKKVADNIIAKAYKGGKVNGTDTMCGYEELTKEEKKEVIDILRSFGDFEEEDGLTWRWYILDERGKRLFESGGYIKYFEEIEEARENREIVKSSLAALKQASEEYSKGSKGMYELAKWSACAALSSAFCSVVTLGSNVCTSCTNEQQTHQQNTEIEPQNPNQEETLKIETTVHPSQNSLVSPVSSDTLTPYLKGTNNYGK